MDMAQFSPIDDDQPEFNPEEFQAGYDACQRGATWATSATRSWRAGWVDAETSIVTKRETSADERAGIFVTP